MFKVMSLMKRKEGMSHEDFSKWLMVEHLAFARKLPGMRKYICQRPAEGNPRSAIRRHLGNVL